MKSFKESSPIPNTDSRHQIIWITRRKMVQLTQSSYLPAPVLSHRSSVGHRPSRGQPPEGARSPRSASRPWAARTSTRTPRGPRVPATASGSAAAAPGASPARPPWWWSRGWGALSRPGSLRRRRWRPQPRCCPCRRRHSLHPCSRLLLQPIRYAI